MLKNALENNDANIWKLMAGSRMMILKAQLFPHPVHQRPECNQRGTSENPLLHHRWRARQRVRNHSVFASDVIVGGDADGDDANGVNGGAG